MIEVNRNLTIDQIEALYSVLNGNLQQRQDLKIPVTTEGVDFGALAALIQFVATWLRSDNSGKLIIPFTNASVQLPEFMQQDYAYPIIILVWRNGIEDESTNEDLRPKLREFTQKINFEMRSLKGIRGNQLLLTCFDHVSATTGLLSCFYDGHSFIGSEDVLDFTLLPTLTHILSFNKESFRKNLTPILEDIKGIIYELMKNTHEWARTDKYNKPLNPNIRGLYARFIKRSKNHLIEKYSIHPGFHDFFDDLPSNDQNQLYFIELSVFDSGAGFIEKFPNTLPGLSITEKLTILKKCLIKRTTAAKGVSATGKGLGLDRIMKILDNKGFFIIRTDQLFVYRNLKRDRYIQTSTVDEIDLFDWQEDSAVQISAMPPVAGSVLSIIYPLT